MGLFSSRPTTVDAALAPLLTAISDLETVNTDRLQDAASKEQEARELIDSATGDRAEARRAQAVLAKLKGLTEADDTETEE